MFLILIQVLAARFQDTKILLKIMKTEKEQAGDDDDDEMEETMETDANDKVST